MYPLCVKYTRNKRRPPCSLRCKKTTKGQLRLQMIILSSRYNYMYVTLVQITNILTSHCISYRYYVFTIVFSSFVVQGRGDEQRISEKSKNATLSSLSSLVFRRDEIMKSLNLCTLGNTLSYIPLTQRQHPGRLGDINRRGISDASLAQEPGVRKFGYLCIQEILVLRKSSVRRYVRSLVHPFM